MNVLLAKHLLFPRPIRPWFDGEALIALLVLLTIPFPLVLGLIFNKTTWGLTFSLGAFALSPRQFPVSPIRTMLPAVGSCTLAVWLGACFAAHELPSFGLVPIIVCAALISRYSPRLIRPFTLFSLYLMIVGNHPAQHHAILGLTLLFCLGACWAVVLPTLFARCIPGSQLVATPTRTRSSSSNSTRTGQTRWQQWWRGLGTLQGWQYALRLALCLSCAVWLAHVWAQTWVRSHGYWIAVTILMVLSRYPEQGWRRNYQRALGTLLGVLILGVLSALTVSLWYQVALLTVFCLARIKLSDSNYIFYTAVNTPLILLLLDFGQLMTSSLLLDRLLATALGCVIALVLGVLIWPESSYPMARQTRRSRQPSGGNHTDSESN